jgi:hypothetical protein
LYRDRKFIICHSPLREGPIENAPRSAIARQTSAEVGEGNQPLSIRRVATAQTANTQQERANTMSFKTEEQLQSAQADAPETPTPSGPTVTKNEAAAQEFTKVLQGLSVLLAEHTRPTDLSPRSLRTRGNVPMEFLTTAIAAVAKSPELQTATSIDIDEATETLQFIQAFSPILVDAEAFVRQLKFVLAVRRASVSAKTRKAYSFAKTIARGSGGEAVEAHVLAMKRSLRRPKAEKSGSQPSPTPSSPTH